MNFSAFRTKVGDCKSENMCNEKGSKPKDDETKFDQGRGKIFFLWGNLSNYVQVAGIYAQRVAEAEVQDRTRLWQLCFCHGRFQCFEEEIWMHYVSLLTPRHQVDVN